MNVRLFNWSHQNANKDALMRKKFDSWITRYDWEVVWLTNQIHYRWKYRWLERRVVRTTAVCRRKGSVVQKTNTGNTRIDGAKTWLTNWQQISSYFSHRKSVCDLILELSVEWKVCEKKHYFLPTNESNKKRKKMMEKINWILFLVLLPIVCVYLRSEWHKSLTVFDNEWNFDIRVEIKKTMTANQKPSNTFEVLKCFFLWVTMADKTLESR